MNEKILYVVLPKGAKYRKVTVTEDGKIGIVYTEECQTIKETVEDIIPKPEPLVGGGPVYRQNDVPYWYCKIKQGRDTFMHLYVEDITEGDVIYDANGRERNFSTTKKEWFKEEALRAVRNKPKEGFRWIPVYEPSLDIFGGLQYVKGYVPATGRGCNKWEAKMSNYSLENESEMMSLTTYMLMLVRWLKDGIVSLDQLVEHSEELGHYVDSKKSRHAREITGKRRLGGLYGFVGNTNKIVKDPDSTSGYSRVGGGYIDEGKYWPAAKVKHVNIYNNHCVAFGVGLMELKK